MELLTLNNVKKSFGAVQAVAGVSFSVKKGECYGLLGPNGAGKSTTLEMIEQITFPDSGEILFEGKKPGRNFQEELGIQFQKTALFPKLTAAECLNTYARFYKNSKNPQTLVETFQLQGFLNRRHEKLSGGQRQRLLLAMALINTPRLILLDEPTTGLDPQSRRILWKAIKEIQKSGTTVILTTHYMEEAENLCDRIAIVDSGKIICEGTPEELISEHLPHDFIEISTSSAPPQTLTDFQNSLDPALGTAELKENKIVVSTQNQREVLSFMLTKDLDFKSLVVRRSNLEDLFIKLTGSSLRD